ncbi:para-aminobenzoate synthase, (PABA) [Coemansia aciculifera]|uniref:Para-aminobenzoate synthase, (PABA) n=1 Tax=Coemansia aciculifera TaxID=417176 RepID=A0ACC1MB05_9FUNG|nr:para-aminobenzoate synthase, (PABA) [Coemansia aciculifera]
MPAPTFTSSSASLGPLRTLLVDNYDSYTLNLLQLLVQQLPAGSSVLDNIIVIRNDQYSWTTVRDFILPHIDSVVISPGPGSPDRKDDFGMCDDLIRYAHMAGLPALGVCLGHQGIAAAFGGNVQQCAVPVHGQTSRVQLVATEQETVTGEPGLFDGVPNLFKVVRYHSLAVSDIPNEQLLVLARAAGTVKALDPATNQIIDVESREIMALRHRTQPLFGVQFHPESICSEYGARILQNFGAISRHHRNGVIRAKPTLPADVLSLSLLAQDNRMWQRHSFNGDDGTSVYQKVGGMMRLVCEAVDLSEYTGDDDIGGDLFGYLYGNDPAPIWLDSASTGGGMSVMASAQTTGSLTVRYSVGERRVKVVRLTSANSSVLVGDDALSGDETFWTWMQAIVDQTRISESSTEPPQCSFQCGWVGYFGYEMSQADNASDCEDRLPDAQLTFVDRCVVVDHKSKPPRAFVMALVADNYQSSQSWMSELGFHCPNDASAWISRQISSIRLWLTLPRPKPKSVSKAAVSSAVTMEPDISRDDYVAAIARAKQWIAQGESYEICLTTQFRHSGATVRSAREMLALYKCMRRHNPAPYGALLWLGDIGAGVASCSPERFLCTFQKDTRERWVEMKPIKGTCRRLPRPDARLCSPSDLEKWERDDEQRARQLQQDAKERAENLMIVDLIRHDLNSIAHNANVQVPQLMAIESYASVHQMVTTVRAQLRSSVGDVAALAHCFPPGSMTGAPKLRTVRLLKELEAANGKGGRRGVYSGCLGFFSAHGQADWSVVIRTAVVDQGGSRVSVGAGGALTILSDPSAEWAEVETKLQSVLPGIRQYCDDRQKGVFID